MSNTFKEFTNTENVTKTIRMGLKPIGKTEEWLDRYQVLEQDEDIQHTKIPLAKKLVAEYRRKEADKVLTLVQKSLDKKAFSKYANETDGKEAKKQFEELAKSVVKQIGEVKTVSKILGNTLNGGYVRELDKIGKSTLTGIKVGSVLYRALYENLKIHKKNIDMLDSIKNVFGDSGLHQFEEILKKNERMFTIDDYLNHIHQKDIDAYNGVISNMNMALNEYYQKNKVKNIKWFERLSKQILSESDVNEEFSPYKNMEEVYSSVRDISGILMNKTLPNLKKFVLGLGTEYPEDYIFFGKESFNLISKITLGSYTLLKDVIIENFKTNNPPSKGVETKNYLNKCEKYYNEIEYLSLRELGNYVDSSKIISYFKKLGERNDEYSQKVDIITELSNLNSLVVDLCENSSKTSKMADKKRAIKEFLENAIKIRSYVKPFDNNQNYACETIISEIMCDLSELKRVYDKTKAFFTKKNFKPNSFRVHFGCGEFLGGFACTNDDFQYKAVLFRDVDGIKLGVINSEKSRNTGSSKKISELIINAVDENSTLERIDFQNMTKQNLCKLSKFDDITEDEKFEIIQKELSGRGYDVSYLEQYKGNIMSAFPMRIMRIKKTSREVIDKLVDEGKLFLFRLYNMDIDRNNGNQNVGIHTKYFLETFYGDNFNMFNPQFYIAGNGKVMYRRRKVADNDEKGDFFVHKAGIPIENKSVKYQKIKPTSTYSYDIQKNRRFLHDQFELHLPLDINNGKLTLGLNKTVNMKLMDGSFKHIIGIDRGERNLLYITIIDLDGNIVEQFPVNEFNGTDYNAKLSEIAKENKNKRSEWEAISSMKSMKDGFMGNVIGLITRLVLKYDAVIAIESLGMNFKRKRQKIEKNVYSSFEEALINKLNFLVDKNLENGIPGSITCPLTLALKKYKGYSQNGAIFSVPPTYTSAIDPVTGFVNLFNMKDTKSEIINMFNKMERISYNKDMDRFEFKFDYKNFPNRKLSKEKLQKTCWTVVSSGDKTRTVKNQYGSSVEIVNPTEEIKQVLGNAGADYRTCNIKQVISTMNHEQLKDMLGCFKLVLKIRNTVGDDDYILSPVINESGNQFDSRLSDGTMPNDADANGSYNIARKALIEIRNMSENYETEPVKAELWLNTVQKNEIPCKPSQLNTPVFSVSYSK